MKSKIKCEVIGYEDIEFEVGQKWKTRSGKVVEIDAVFNESTLSYPVEGGGLSYTRTGEEFKHRKGESDLVELVSNTTEELIAKPVAEPIAYPFAEPVAEPVEDWDEYEEPVEEPTEWYEEPTDSRLEIVWQEELTVEDKMAGILIQLLSQRDKDLEKLSLVFNTYIQLEKMR